MADKFFSCIVTITKTMLVRVPVDMPDVMLHDTAEDVAAEFATDGSFSDYVVEEDQNEEVEVREVPAPIVSPQAAA